MMLQPENGLGTEQWLKLTPEDVFYAGVLSHKFKGSYKYQSVWGVLRFESAMGPKRLELYEPDSKEKYFVINANVYPLTTIPFTQILGLHPDHTIRPGVFSFKVMTTDKKFCLAAKTKEEQQEWLAKIDTLLFGTPLPNRTCEYSVMVFPTKSSEEMNLRGQYIFKVTEHNVHLISRDTSLHMAFNIPLGSIVKANHSVFYNSSIQFAPLSDRKSTVKALALTVEMDCSLGKRGYVFAATSAAEIASIINERRTRLFQPCPSTVPVHPNTVSVRSSPLSSNSSNIYEESLTHSEVVQLMESIKQGSTKTTPGCGELSPMRPPLPPMNGTVSLPRFRNLTYADRCAAAQVSHQNRTLPNPYSDSPGTQHINSPSGSNISLTDSTSCGARHSGKKQEKASRKMVSSRQIERTKQYGGRKLSLPMLLTSRFHPKKIIQSLSPTRNLLRASRGSQTSLADEGCPTNGNAGPEDSVVESQAPFHRAMLHNRSTESVVMGDEDDCLSMTSSASSHGTVNRCSPNTPLTPPVPTCTFTNLRCLMCSKTHCDEKGPCFVEAEPQRAKWEHLNSEASSIRFQRSRSLADLVDSPPSQNSTPAETDFPLEPTNPCAQFTRSDSHDALPMNNYRRQLPSTLAMNHHSQSKPVDSTEKASHVSSQTSIYLSIPNNGPYEQVPKVKMEDIMARNNTRHYSVASSTSCWLRGNGLQVVAVDADKETDEDTYESIANSGPYEQVPSVAFCAATKCPVAGQAPLSLPPRRKTTPTAHCHTPTVSVGNYESIPNDSSTMLHIISKRHNSPGDASGTDSKCRNLTNSKSPREQELAQLSPGNHHVMNLEVSGEQQLISPPPLPYAVVWLER